MAIDDNTLYGLTGAQVKELPEKIEAVKGLARELTADDYNFHTSGDTDNKIALWLLPPGIYCWNRDLNQNILLTRSQSVTFGGNGMGAIVMDGHSYKPILLFNEMSQGFGLNYWGIANGGYYGSGKWVSFSLVDNLTTDHGYEALSAKQGKVLKDLIDSIAIRGAGAPTTSTVGQVGTLYEDTTNGDLYICTDATNPYVWEEVGGGGGGLDPNTTFWGQTASNGAVTGRITFGTNGYVNGTNNTVTVYADTAGGADPFEFSHTGLDVASKKITNLAAPTANGDAATKGYVDNSLLGKQDTLTAGSGISIADESGSLVISTTVAEPDEFTSNEWNALWS